MSEYSGFHVGIVIENDDPNYGGRVKVYVPEHSPNLDKLNKWIKEGKEIKFNAIDKEMSPELVEILDDLKESLPWAEYAGPIFGGSSDGRFRCPVKTTSTNDDVSFGKNDSQTGQRPLNNFMGSDVPVDDFYVKEGRTIALLNQNATDYEPSNYSGMVRGIFSIPNVGAQVYVFYLNDDPMYPVYFAAAYNPDSIKRIYSMTQFSPSSKGGDKKPRSLDGLSKMWDYPGEFENSNEDTDESKIFRSKTVINSNKHTIEFIDTDGYEALRFQHFGGGFKQFHNYGAVEFTPGNDQQLVKGDQFLTVNGDRGVSIGGNESFRVRGNSHIQIGEYDDNVENVGKVKAVLDELADYKRLFTVKRTASGLPPGDTSSKQERKPANSTGFVTCPTCGGLPYDPYNVNGLNVGGTYINDQTEDGKKEQKKYFETHRIWYTDDDSVQVKSTSGTSIVDDIEYGWSRIPRALEYCNPEFYIPPPYFSEEYLNGTVTSNEEEEVDIENVTDAEVDNPTLRPHEQHKGAGKVGVFGGIKCPTCNNMLWENSPQTSAWAVDTASSGYSPSTENGKWVEESLTKSGLAMQIVKKFKDVAQSLVKMGDGGDRIETITMSKIENIGTVFNDIPSFRVDPIGKLRLDGLFVTQQSTVPYYLPTPHVEPVDVTNVPGGDYNLTVGNKWNVMVGSNGINIKTTGSLQIGGAITNIAVQELNLSAKHDMVIDGGERLMIRARKVTVNPVEHNAFTVDGQVHVLRNMIVRGGTLIEGELAVQHVTAPGELALTGPELWMGSVEERCEVPVSLQFGEETLVEEFTLLEKDPPNIMEAINSVGSVVNNLLELLTGEVEATLRVPYHTHTFLQIPTSFKDCPNAVRAELLGEGRNINSRQIVASARRRHHIGILTEDSMPFDVYSNPLNKKYFDELIYDAIFRVFTNEDFQSSFNKKFVRGLQPGSLAPGNPTTYAMFFYSGVQNDTGICLFYTAIDYYNSATNAAGICPEDKGLTKNSDRIIVKLDFKLARVSDDSSMGEMEGGNTSDASITNTDAFTEEDLAAGYVKGSERAQVQGTGWGMYGRQFAAAKESAELQLEAWNGSFGMESSRCVAPVG